MMSGAVRAKGGWMAQKKRRFEKPITSDPMPKVTKHRISNAIGIPMLKILASFCIICSATDAIADPVASVRYFESNGQAQMSLTGGATERTPFTLASVGKTMTSVAILRLVADRKLSLDGRASRWIDDDIAKGLGGLDDISLRHLLTMTSGLPDYLTDDYVSDAVADPATVQNQKTALSYAFDQDRLFDPGTEFDYSNTNYVLLGLILEDVTGLSYAQVLERQIFRPAGMARSFVFGSSRLPPDFPNGHEGSRHVRSYYKGNGFGDGGVISTVGDVAKFYKALFADRSLLPRGLMGELTRDQFAEGYGMGLEIESGIVGHSGGDLGFSSDVRMEVGSGDIAIILVAHSDADTDWTFDRLGVP